MDLILAQALFQGTSVCLIPAPCLIQGHFLETLDTAASPHPPSPTPLPFGRNGRYLLYNPCTAGVVPLDIPWEVHYRLPDTQKIMVYH